MGFDKFIKYSILPLSAKLKTVKKEQFIKNKTNPHLD